MVSTMVTVSLSPKGKKIARLPSSVSTYEGASGREVAELVSGKTGLGASRLRFTGQKDGKVLGLDDKVSGDVHLLVKDLGPQISWRGVFVAEYAGPLILHPLIFAIYREHSSGQWMTLGMVVLHFLKREYETLFVHRFSADTMPLSNLFKNCAYYWIVGGALLAATTYSPQFAQETYKFPRYQVLLWVFSELANWRTHKILRDLRPPGTRERRIPRGFGFDMVSCPNYTFEVASWVAVALITNAWSCWAFALLGFAQMTQWAFKKHRRYIKEFKDYPKDRKAIIPYIL
ncbi:Very-long-chain enoyl-CoA reductase [Savitreella phatthalungensis]